MWSAPSSGKSSVRFLIECNTMLLVQINHGYLDVLRIGQARKNNRISVSLVPEL